MEITQDHLWSPVKIFLDDVRTPLDCGYMWSRIFEYADIYNDPWVVVRNGNEFQKAIMEHHKEITHISFDHDLEGESGVGPNSGAHLAEWTKFVYEKLNWPLPTILIHSQNIYGVQHIRRIFPQAIS